MRAWSDQRIAGTARAQLLRGPGRAAGGPERVVIDSRAVGPGDLFVGLPGERTDGGRFAVAALRAGAWGVLVAPAYGREAAVLADGDGAVLVTEDPLAALGALARGWRQDLAAHVIAVTGSVGKTSTKDLIAALVSPHRTTVASRANFNTEIGLPLEILAAPAGTEVLVLELGMRGAGQIAELTAICEPDVGVITNIGPVHLEQLGSLAGIAAAKGELLDGLREGATAVVPADEPLLAPHVRAGLRTVRFGAGGDVRYARPVAALGRPVGVGSGAGRRARVTVLAGDDRHELDVPFSSRHLFENLLAAVAAARGIGVRPAGRVDVEFGALRGERVALPGGAVLINDCYNANPLSMRAALDDLALQETAGRRIAVLGDMLELGPDERGHHERVGEHAARTGVELLIAVGPRAAWMGEPFRAAGGASVVAVPDAAAAAERLGELVGPDDLVLVKGSRGVGLEVVAETLAPAADGA
jgi:UDP-N-acetylmuramoyl-tripeptide--D-alanyl-D-alanine ligase